MVTGVQTCALPICSGDSKYSEDTEEPACHHFTSL
jgi:hypothetical protein